MNNASQAVQHAPAHASAQEQQQWRLQWSIGIYQGASPLALAPSDAQDRPALTSDAVTDIDAYAVADPFLLHLNGVFYLFFEVLNKATDCGEVAYATSLDGLTWQYGAVVLREPFHLSYPFVFAHGGDVFMVPETRQDASVRLYVAEAFPLRWRCLGKILTGPYADSTIVQHEDRWWLFAERGLDELCIFHSRALVGPWQPHPANPLWPGNRRYSRPGGRILRAGGQLLRFAQDSWPAYGSRLHAFAIDRLTTEQYVEHLCPQSPILKATGRGWNALAMHHLDAVEVAPGQWLAAVDGAGMGLV